MDKEGKDVNGRVMAQVAGKMSDQRCAPSPTTPAWPALAGSANVAAGRVTRIGETARQ